MTGRSAVRCFHMLIVGLILVFSACTTSQNPQPQATANRVQTEPTGAQQNPAEAEDGQWLMPAKNYASTRYSGLDQINADNVKTLKVAWTFSTGVNRGHEAAPLVVGDMMYVVTPYPNI